MSTFITTRNSTLSFVPKTAVPRDWREVTPEEILKDIEETLRLWRGMEIDPTRLRADLLRSASPFSLRS